MVVPVMPVSQAVGLSAALVGTGLVIIVAAAVQQQWHRQP